MRLVILSRTVNSRSLRNIFRLVKADTSQNDWLLALNCSLGLLSLSTDPSQGPTFMPGSVTLGNGHWHTSLAMAIVTCCSCQEGERARREAGQCQLSCPLHWLDDRWDLPMVSSPLSIREAFPGGGGRGKAGNRQKWAGRGWTGGNLGLGGGWEWQ